ncbi:MAG: CoA transferase [Chloroflexota bacterium]|nr:CoA transferase [Chloroflexota bacterium]
MKGPLEGVRVLELGSLISAPFACRLLADYGARVIKVEPLSGDPLRQWGRSATAWDSYASLVQSRNKDLIAVDLHTPEGQELVRKLAGQVDVVVENFRPGRLSQWGLGFEELVRLYPSLIMISISGYGQTGPYRDRPGFGNIAESMGGLRAVTGYADGPPLRVGVSLGDQLASLYAVIGALLALRVRDMRGEGEHVDVALTEAVVSVTEAGIPEYVHEGAIQMRNGNRLGRAAPTGVYPTCEGQWVAVGANGDSIFRRFAREIGRSDWADDEELATNQGRVRRVDELDNAIIAWTERHSMSEVVDRLNRAGVPCGPVYTVKDIAEDPHFRARGALIEVVSPERNGLVTMPGVMPALERHPGRVERTGGPVGRDTESVLTDLLGLDRSAIVELATRNIVALRQSPPEVTDGLEDDVG